MSVHEGRPPELTDLVDDEAWRAFLNQYSDIVLVANSDEADPRRLLSTYPPTALFVFFNKAYKVLDTDFPGRVVLFARSGSMGANIAHRGEVEDVVRLFSKSKFLGIVNIRAAEGERFSDIADFKGVTSSRLDLEPFVRGKYPPARIPTTGFAVVAWLRELKIDAKISLAGFSGRRGVRWKVFDVHDWTFEQSYLRICAKNEIISGYGVTSDNRFELLGRHFPALEPDEIQKAVDETLARRLDDALGLIDHLMSVTKWQRALDSAFRRMRPKTRKQRSEARGGDR